MKHIAGKYYFEKWSIKKDVNSVGMKNGIILSVCFCISTLIHAILYPLIPDDSVRIRVSIIMFSLLSIFGIIVEFRTMIKYQTSDWLVLIFIIVWALFLRFNIMELYDIP